MKPKLLFILAALCALSFAADTKTEADKNALFVSSDRAMNITLSPSKEYGSLIAASTGDLVMQWDGREVWRLIGFPRPDPKRFPVYDYALARLRPDEPDDVTVIIHTSDGKRWRAKWVEDVAP